MKDYVEANITTALDTDNFATAMTIVDPIVYADIVSAHTAPIAASSRLRVVTHAGLFCLLPQLTMPKLIISTSGDEFLMPDNNDYVSCMRKTACVASLLADHGTVVPLDSLQYWDALQGEKHFHQFQNLEHSMAENIPLVLDTIRGFVVNLQSNTSRPNYFWSVRSTLTLSICGQVTHTRAILC